jgi:hypothetical protein
MSRRTLCRTLGDGRDWVVLPAAATAAARVSMGETRRRATSGVRFWGE